MKYLIDTDIASYYLRGKFKLFDIFKDKGISDIRISRVSIAELEVLAFRNPNSVINFSSIETFAKELGVIEIDGEIWRTFSRLKSETLNKGKRRGDIDILNASVATQYSMILVTNNTPHYEDLVHVENWAVK
jgi:tRNA(fMet)-specific endonuclease VapC